MEEGALVMEGKAPYLQANFSVGDDIARRMRELLNDPGRLQGVIAQRDLISIVHLRSNWRIKRLVVSLGQIE